MLVAIDRTSKFAFVQLHENQRVRWGILVTQRMAGDFLRALIKAVPYRVDPRAPSTHKHLVPGPWEW